MAPDPADGGPPSAGDAPDGGGPDPEGIDRALIDLTDDERRAAARDARRHEHALRRMASESGTVRGALVDLGERRRAIVIHLACGTEVRGAVRAVGTEVAVLDLGHGASSAVALAHLVAVREEPGGRPVLGDRPVTARGSWADVLAPLAAERTGVGVRTRSGSHWSGRLGHLGEDLLVLGGGLGAPPLMIPFDALCEVTWS